MSRRTGSYLLSSDNKTKRSRASSEGTSRFSTPLQEIARLKERLLATGAHLMQPVRPGAQDRFFSRETVDGYVFEAVARG